MSTIKEGDAAIISYNAKLKDGSVIDRSPLDKPFKFIYGIEIVLPELEKAVLEMEIGETKMIVLSPDKAYGFYDENLVIPIPKNSLPKNFEVEVGQDFIYSTEDEIRRVKVSLEDDINLYFDHNHPLAGQTLNYEITLLGISKNH